MTKKVLIIGGDSDLGKGLIKKFQNRKYEIYSSTRKNKKNSFFRYDLKDTTKKNFSISKTLKKNFDFVLFIAALTTASKEVQNKKCTFGNLEYGNYLKLLTLNCYAPIKTFEYLKLKKFLNKNSKIIFFSSLAGSITNRGHMSHNKPFGNMFYRISKAALNCAVKNLAYDFKKDHIMISIHPGFVRTRSGGKKADLSINYASNKIFKTIVNLKKSDNGKFLDFKGKEILW